MGLLGFNDASKYMLLFLPEISLSCPRNPSAWLGISSLNFSKVISERLMGLFPAGEAIRIGFDPDPDEGLFVPGVLWTAPPDCGWPLGLQGGPGPPTSPSATVIVRCLLARPGRPNRPTQTDRDRPLLQMKRHHTKHQIWGELWCLWSALSLDWFVLTNSPKLTRLFFSLFLSYYFTVHSGISLSSSPSSQWSKLLLKLSVSEETLSYIFLDIFQVRSVAVHQNTLERPSKLWW